MAIPELLAPAGSIETFHAAIEAGADAVYLGFGSFNARKRAKNFTERELRLASAHAHRLGRKVYLTLNTLVFDGELPAVLELLELASEIRADAVIVQDLGVLSLLRDHFPHIPAHASTQTFCHNSLHTEFLTRNGVSRVILPRELSLAEIGAMMARVHTEYEVFVHGAMCFSFSGCCLASSWLRGDSGNRGRCRQVCRYAFETSSESSHPFSMRDLDGLSVVEEIVRLGVSSLKIEGRLKSADYVSRTVAAYRAALDAAGRREPSRELPDLPRQRETTWGYFEGGLDYERLVQRETSGTAGEPFGRAFFRSPRQLEIDYLTTPAKGLRLRVQDAAGRNVHEGVLLDFARDQRHGRRTLTWRLGAEVDCRRFTAPFTVYAIGKSAPSRAPAALRGDPKRVAVDAVAIEAELRDGSLRVRAETRASRLILEREYPVPTERSITSPLSEEACERIMRQVDANPFEVESIACRVEDGLFCRVGALKDARRAFYVELHDAHRDAAARQRIERRERLQQALREIGRRRASNDPPRTLRVDDGEAALASDGVGLVALPVELDGEPRQPPSSSVFLYLPHFVPEHAIDRWKERLNELLARGYERFVAPTYGWLTLLGELPCEEIIAGPYCYALNSPAVDLLERSGASPFVLSPDVREEDTGPITSYRGRVVIGGASQEMFISRLRLPEAEYRLKNRVFRARRLSEYTVVEALSASSSIRPRKRKEKTRRAR